MSQSETKQIIEKLECFETKLDDHIKKADAFMTDMMPVKDGLHVFQSIIRFFKFVGIPTTVILATVYWLIKRL